MSKRAPIVGGNWKLNTDLATGLALAGAVRTLVAAATSVEIFICPPFPYLLPVGEKLRGSNMRLGAQDVYHEVSGAFTGEVSVSMLKDCRVEYVLVGHSERRHIIGESDDLINRKARATLAAGMRCVLCIGETLAEREAAQADAVNERQLRAGLAGVTPEQLSRLVIAYEPVWAIGTGKTASPADAQSAHQRIRTVFAAMFGLAAAAAIRIIYGGSVKVANAADLFNQPDIDGGLVGGGSLNAEEIAAIIFAANASAAAS